MMIWILSSLMFVALCNTVYNYDRLEKLQKEHEKLKGIVAEITNTVYKD